MDTEEMTRRGIADAEQGEVHPFFYQHYYPYRRAYDRARRQLRQPALLPRNRRRTGLLIGVVALVLLSGFVLLRRSQGQAALTASALAPATTSSAALVQASATPIFPTATPLPTPTPVALRSGGLATVVNLKDGALRAREAPSLQSPVKATFRDGDQVNVTDGPVEADSYTWWRIESERGAGWSAQQSAEGVAWLQPRVE